MPVDLLANRLCHLDREGFSALWALMAGDFKPDGYLRGNVARFPLSPSPYQVTERIPASGLRPHPD